MATLSEMGEHAVIRRLTSMLKPHADLTVGAGDDCAVVQVDGSAFDQVFTTDPVVEGVHFEAGEAPRRIGNKAAGRVLSDLAAMGARPQWLLVNVTAPSDLEFEVLEEIYGGMNALCARFGATIIGGDLAQGPVLELHVFGTGLVPSGAARLRSGAQVGDLLFVTGPLGGSLAGKHLDFVPRVDEGVFLRESGLVNAMMDVSDGLATDLRHILKQSGVGAVLEAEKIPRNGTLEQALYDGEDFELLFSLPADKGEGLIAGWNAAFAGPLHEIGRITAQGGMLELQCGGCVELLSEKAFEHFSGRGQGGVS